MAKFTIRAMEPAEIEQVGMGMARVFGRTAEIAHWMQHEWTQRYPHRPGFSPALHRVGVLDGQIVSHVLLETYTLRYGGARLRVVGIGKVYTDPVYQRRGYSAAVIRDALTRIIEMGAHLALLNGIRGYYPRFGFNPVFPDYTATFDAAEIAALPTPLTVREPRLQDIPILAALFERHWGGRVTFTRSPESWLWRVLQGDDGKRVLVVCGEDDVPQGYIAGQNFIQPEVEVVADTPDAALTLLSICGQWAVDAGQPEVRWLMPPDDALVAFAQQIVTVNLSARYEPDGGWMARLIDVQGLIEALLPEVIQQARLTMPDLEAEKLILVPRADGIQIGLRQQPDTLSRLSPADFIRVVFGSLSPAALGHRSQLSAASVHLLQTLFPPRVAMLGGWDWF